MTLSRYSNDQSIKGRTVKQTAKSVNIIRQSLKNGSLQSTTRILQGEERLDVLAGVLYEDAKLWWILAAASNIGWGLQVPPGTIIVIPNLNQVISLIG